MGPMYAATGTYAAAPGSRCQVLFHRDTVPRNVAAATGPARTGFNLALPAYLTQANAARTTPEFGLCFHRDPAAPREHGHGGARGHPPPAPALRRQGARHGRRHAGLRQSQVSGCTQRSGFLYDADDHLAHAAARCTWPVRSRGATGRRLRSTRPGTIRLPARVRLARQSRQRLSGAARTRSSPTHAWSRRDSYAVSAHLLANPGLAHLLVNRAMSALPPAPQPTTARIRATSSADPGNPRAPIHPRLTARC